MSRRLFRTLSIPAALAFATTAQAAGPISPDSDVLGIKLTMTRDQAQAAVTSAFPGAKIVDLPVTVQTPEYKQSTSAGFFADVTSKDDQANNQQQNAKANQEFEAKRAAGMGNSFLNRTVAQPGDFGREIVFVQTNPNEGQSDIFGVSHYREYPRSAAVVTNVLLKAFIDKYGAPTISNKTNLAWLQPGILREANRIPRVQCDLQFFGDHIFYEDPAQVSPQYIGASFVASLNSLPFADQSPTLNKARCGTVLELVLGLSNDGQYVYKMSTVFMDVPKARAELKQFQAAFQQHIQAVKQQQLDKASQNKPRL